MTGMTNAREQTVRTWSATADAQGPGTTAATSPGRCCPRCASCPVSQGAYLLRRDLDGNGTVELTAHTFWESPEVIRAFAGDDITVAIVEPEARAMLLDFDRTATHRSVIADARG